MLDIESDQCSGFREHEHTADWELEVWAPDIPGLLEQAARGMYRLVGLRLVEDQRLTHHIELSISDSEGLIVDFLSELLFLLEQEGIAFDEFSLNVDQDVLYADLAGAPVRSVNKEIKAVTYHKLAIHHTTHGLRVNIVFDV